MSERGGCPGDPFEKLDAILAVATREPGSSPVAAMLAEILTTMQDQARLLEELPAEMVEMADYYLHLRGVKRAEVSGTAAIPRQDMPPCDAYPNGMNGMSSISQRGMVWSSAGSSTPFGSGWRFAVAVGVGGAGKTTLLRPSRSGSTATASSWWTN